MFGKMDSQHLLRGMQSDIEHICSYGVNCDLLCEQYIEHEKHIERELNRKSTNSMHVPGKEDWNNTSSQNFDTFI